MKRNLKNAMFIGFVLMICALFASTAMAENEYGLIDPPDNFVEVEDLVPGEVCFSWTAVDEATKYSIAIEVLVADEVHEFDFGSNDYGLEVIEGEGDKVQMCIPLYEIAVDGEPLSGPAIAKIKGLDPGKYKGRQNNEFSETVEFILPGPEVE
jgi:hypothetical protein